MFSDLYYLSTLIDKSLSFSQIEKQRIFNYVKINKNEIKRLIKIFEDEQVWLNFIKKDYENNLNKIWKQFKTELIEWIKNTEDKERNLIRNKIKEMNIIEQNENDIENLDNIINNI